MFLNTFLHSRGFIFLVRFHKPKALQLQVSREISYVTPAHTMALYKYLSA